MRCDATVSPHRAERRGGGGGDARHQLGATERLENQEVKPAGSQARRHSVWNTTSLQASTVCISCWMWEDNKLVYFFFHSLRFITYRPPQYYSRCTSWNLNFKWTQISQNTQITSADWYKIVPIKCQIIFLSLCLFGVPTDWTESHFFTTITLNSAV